MGFSLSGIAKSIGNFFGGDDDEEKKKRQQQQQQAAQQAARQQAPQLTVPQNNRSQNIQQLLTPTKPAMSNPGIQLFQSNQTGAVPMPNSTPAPVPKADPDAEKKAELAKLEADAFAKRKAEREKGENIWSRNVGIGWLGGNKNSINENAQVLAKSDAAKQYQEAHGYTKDPTVLQLNKDARAISDRTSARLQQDAHVLDNVDKGATKAAQVAQYVPVTGTVLNLGLAGSERAARDNGDTAYADEIANSRYKNEFGMTKQQFDALDPKVQAKLHNVRNAGYALSPLDFTGLGGLGKSEAVAVGKDAAIQLVKEGSIDVAKKEALKTAGKQLVKRELINTGVAAAGQQYLSGKVDPLEALKTGTMLTGTGELFNPVNLEKSAKAPGMKSTNPNLIQDATKQIQNEAAQTAATVSKTSVDPATGKAIYSPRDAQTLGTQNPGAELDTPTFQRKPAQQAAQNADDAARIERERQAAIADPENETPAYQRQGKQLPSETPEVINQKLQNNAAAIASDPAMADAVGKSFRETGNNDPLNLLVNHLSQNPSKREVRAIVARLLPDVDSNTFNRAVNEITGAENPAEVHAALDAATGRKVEPFGVLSDAPAPEPASLPQPVETPPVAATDVPAVVNPQEAVPATAAVPTPSAVAEAAPAPGVLETTPPVPGAVAPGEVLPSIPENAPGAAQVPVAPRTREAAMAQLGELAKEIPGDGKMRDVTNLDDLATSAQGAIEQLTPEELVGTMGSSNISAIQNDAKGFAILRASRDKLSQMLREDPGNGDIAEALSNTLDEMANRASGGGQLLRVVQEEFDNMPVEAKVRYLIKKIDAANQNVEGYDSIRRDPAKLQLVENELNYRLSQSQTEADKLASLTALAQHAADAAREGEKVDLKGIAKEVTGSTTELQRLNGELVKYFETQVPKRSLANRALVDTPKRMMLFSGTGRLNDVLSTAFNVADQQATNITQGIIGKGVNAVSKVLGRPGLVTDTSLGAGKLPTGAWQGLKRTVGEIRGNQYTENLQSSLKGNEDLRSGLQKSRGKLSRTIQASTELATNLTEGSKTQRLVQLADQEARKLGLKGEMKKQYTEARTIAPSKQMLETADKLKMEMNNLNENPVSRKLNQVSSSIGGNSVVGGIIKNQILPFTSWLGGNIYNSVTDKNAVASFVKFGNALRKGDAEGAVRNAARTINGVTQAYVLGYQLTKSGMLTDKNAEGYGDDGPFVHVGDRYIPVKFFGFFAPNIVLGNAAYSATEGNTENKSPAVVLADKIGNYSWNSLAFGQALGTDNTVNRAAQVMNRPGGSKADAAATLGGGIAGQYIPGLTGDVNAVLDNNTSLNPTREAPETRVGKTGLTPSGRESKAKDVPASVAAGLQARIPIASQMLPRKEGVAAKDLVDRTVRGDQDTSKSKNDRAVAKSEVDQAADFKKRGIPNFKEKDFDDKVQARFDNGDYDSAIEGLTTKYNSIKDNKDIPVKQKKDLEDKIALNEVHKQGKFDREMVDTYRKYSVSEWRDFGDSESDTYNPKLYQKLYDYDNALAKAGISGNENDKTQNKYTPKKDKSGSGKGGKSPAIGNTLGSIEQLSKIDFGGLKLEKTPSSAKIPTIATVQPGELIKKREISVKRGR